MVQKFLVRDRSKTHALGRVCLSVGICALVLCLAPQAAQAKESELEGLICSLVTLVQTDIGTAVATAAVIALGYQAALGRIGWALPFTTACGIIIMLAAGDLAKIITGEPSPCGVVKIIPKPEPVPKSLP